MIANAAGFPTYDALLDAYNDAKRANDTLTFAEWYQAVLSKRPYDGCDHPDLPPVWIDEQQDDDGLMGVSAPKKPSPNNNPPFLQEFLPLPENDEDPRQLVHA